MSKNNDSSLKIGAGLSFLLGIWWFASPWIYGVYRSEGSSYNNWVVGVLITMFAALRYVSPATTRGLSYANMVSGAWVFASPWIFSYSHASGRFVNSLCVGGIVFIASIYSSLSTRHPTTGHGTSSPVRP
jgi:hypothetical protein